MAGSPAWAVWETLILVRVQMLVRAVFEVPRSGEFKLR